MKMSETKSNQDLKKKIEANVALTLWLWMIFGNSLLQQLLQIQIPWFGVFPTTHISIHKTRCFLNLFIYQMQFIMKYSTLNTALKAFSISGLNKYFWWKNANILWNIKKWSQKILQQKQRDKKNLSFWVGMIFCNCKTENFQH